MSDHIPLTKEALVSQLRLSLSSTTFYCDGTIYKLVFRTAMGSSVTVVVARVVIEHVEDCDIETSPVTTTFYCKRYVDDVLSAVPVNRVSEMLTHINSIDKNTRFTLESEIGNVISYLDVEILLNPNGSLSLSSPKCTANTPTWTSTYCSLPTTP